MDNFTLKKVLLIIMLAILPATMIAQEQQKAEKFLPKNYWFIAADGGGTMFYGDNNRFPLSSMRFDANIGGGYAFAKYFAVYARLGLGQLSSKRDGLFEIKHQDFIRCDLNFSADLISIFGGYNPNRIFALDIHAGIGNYQFRVEGKAHGEDVRYGYSDSPEGMKGKGINGRMSALEIPLGLMFRFNVSRRIDLYADINYVHTGSDYLDGCKSSKRNDCFFEGNIGIRYKFLKKQAPQLPAEETLPVEAVATEQPAEETPVQPEVAAEVVVAKPAVKEPTRRELRFVLVFIVNDANIANTTITNTTINKMVSDIASSVGNSKIETVKVDGYASPEGSNDYNIYIARERANSAKGYMEETLGDNFKNASLNIASHGADWVGFTKVLLNSNRSDKNNIINELDKSNNKPYTLWKFGKENPEIKDLYKDLRRVEIVMTLIDE